MGGYAHFPGDSTSGAELLRLADEYRRAALALASLERQDTSISRSPYRFAAIHATELYLSALLLHFGDTPAVVRELRHDLVARTGRALARGLVLRRRTDAHLRTMAASHEYQISRYAPELGATLSQVNRLAATLEEVSAKTRAIICEGENPTKIPGRPGVSSGSSKAA